MNRILAKRMKENIYYQYDSSQLPEISLADTAVIEPPYIHKRRMPLEYIIYLVRQGEMFLLEDGVRYHLTPGDFLILDPDKIHVGERATHCEYHYIHFHQKSIKKNKMTNEQTTEIILRKRTQSMQSDSCTLSGQERVSLSLLALPKYMHLSDTSSYSEILQKINDGITYLPYDFSYLSEKSYGRLLQFVCLSDFGDDDFGFQTVCNIACPGKNRSGRKLPENI